MVKEKMEFAETSIAMLKLGKAARSSINCLARAAKDESDLQRLSKIAVPREFEERRKSALDSARLHIENERRERLDRLRNPPPQSKRPAPRRPLTTPALRNCARLAGSPLPAGWPAPLYRRASQHSFGGVERRMKELPGKTWNVPAIARGFLPVRNTTYMGAYLPATGSSSADRYPAPCITRCLAATLVLSVAISAPVFGFTSYRGAFDELISSRILCPTPKLTAVWPSSISKS